MNLKKIKLSSLFIILNTFVLFTSVLFIEEIYKLQFSESEYFKNQALSNRQKVEVIEAKRGSILDREFNEVSETINAFNIGIYPEKIDDKELVSELLSPLLQLDKVLILERLNNNKNYFYLKRNIDFETGTKIKNFDIIINATSLGLKNGDDFNFNFSNTKNEAIYIDTIYNPLETKTFKYLKEEGRRVFNGLDMFIYQGQKSFYLWNKINPEIDDELVELLNMKLK